MSSLTAFDLSSRQIALVQQTIAKDCNADEFNLFMEAAKSYGLDPFRKQIMPLVFSKDDVKKRRMSIVVSRDGLRVIAQRCRNYRPASKPPEIVFDEALKGATNPKGIVLARVFLWQQDSRGEWFEVAGEAYWDEFAPISFPHDAYDWIDTGEVWEDSGKAKKKRVLKKGSEPALDTSGNWARMPIVMISKCAEAQALRAGWPDQFGGVYAEDEMEQAKVLDLSATEIVEQERTDARLKQIGAADSITVTWGDGWQLENVPLGQFADKAVEFLRVAKPEDAARWEQANRAGLQTFWAKRPTDALELKKIIEKAKAEKVPA